MHAPLFCFKSTRLKLKESPLSEEGLNALAARRYATFAREKPLARYSVLMRSEHSSQMWGVSRREFLAASSVAMLARTLTESNAAESSTTISKLALHGGERAVKQSAKLPIRWGEPERRKRRPSISKFAATFAPTIGASLGCHFADSDPIV